LLTPVQTIIIWQLRSWVDWMGNTRYLWLNPHTQWQWTCLHIWTCSIIYWNPQSS
jgi:hypothetical protein